MQICFHLDMHHEKHASKIMFWLRFLFFSQKYVIKYLDKIQPIHKKSIFHESRCQLRCFPPRIEDHFSASIDEKSGHKKNPLPNFMDTKKFSVVKKIHLFNALFMLIGFNSILICLQSLDVTFHQIEIVGWPFFLQLVHLNFRLVILD